MDHDGITPLQEINSPFKAEQTGVHVTTPATDYQNYNATTVQPAAEPSPITVATNVVMPGLGSKSQRISCPYCNEDVSTAVVYTETSRTHIIALLLCLIGCCPCCLLPYCIDDCKVAEHNCPKCGRHLGRQNE